MGSPVSWSRRYYRLPIGRVAASDAHLHATGADRAAEHSTPHTNLDFAGVAHGTRAVWYSITVAPFTNTSTMPVVGVCAVNVTFIVVESGPKI